MTVSEQFSECLQDALAPLGVVTLRRMFGKAGVFCNGLMFGVVSDDVLYFRVDDDNREAFKEAEAYPPLSYVKQGRTIDLAFWQAPDRLYDDPDELLAWARTAMAAAQRVAARRARSSPRRRPLPERVRRLTRR